MKTLAAILAAWALLSTAHVVAALLVSLYIVAKVTHAHAVRRNGMALVRTGGRRIITGRF